MFAPNSIKTLMSIKNYNQLEQGKESTGKGSPEKNTKSTKDEGPLEEFSQKNSRDLSEKVINTRVLLKEIDYKLEDLKKWKQRQRKELARKLQENKALIEPINEKEVFRAEDESYEKYIKKLEEMMELYQKDLEEARIAARHHDSNNHTIMKEIGSQLSEREQKIAELSSQLSIFENQKSFNEYEKEIDFVGDIQTLKNNLDSWKKDSSLGSLKLKTHKSLIESKENIAGANNVDSIKKFLEKEKQEVLKEKKYDFKNDLDDIESELQELEELLNSK